MLIVQKYGGSSLRDTSCLLRVVERIKNCYLSGDDLLIVVSAPQGQTDTLLQRAHAITDHPDKRSLDALLATGEWTNAALLAMTLQNAGVPAKAFNAAQAQIFGTSQYGDANITYVEPKALQNSVNDREIAVVCGFQAITQGGDFVTLGRGGSDLTAIALAHYLQSDRCEIYTDVNGVYAVDPNLFPNAKKFDHLDWDEMYLLASHGAKVMQAKSVDFARSHRVSFEVKSTFVPTTSGTYVGTRACGALNALMVHNRDAFTRHVTVFTHMPHAFTFNAYWEKRLTHVERQPSSLTLSVSAEDSAALIKDLAQQLNLLATA